jgi:enoyl-CoA hydratase/carnithine racemase
MTVAAQLATLSPRAVAAAKIAMSRGAEMPLEDGLRLEALLADALATDQQR